jgi:hypothetical protein
VRDAAPAVIFYRVHPLRNYRKNWASFRIRVTARWLATTAAGSKLRRQGLAEEFIIWSRTPVQMWMD